MIGMICANPTPPRTSAEPVRLYNSQPSATVNICCPNELIHAPVSSKRKSRKRSARYGSWVPGASGMEGGAAGATIGASSVLCASFSASVTGFL